MKTVTATICLIASGLTPAMADEITNETDDPIVASFERELNHKPIAAQPATRADIDEDVLYELVNKPLQDTETEKEVMVAKNDGEDA